MLFKEFIELTKIDREQMEILGVENLIKRGFISETETLNAYDRGDFNSEVKGLLSREMIIELGRSGHIRCIVRTPEATPNIPGYYQVPLDFIEEEVTHRDMGYVAYITQKSVDDLLGGHLRLAARPTSSSSSSSGSSSSSMGSYYYFPQYTANTSIREAKQESEAEKIKDRVGTENVTQEEMYQIAIEDGRKSEIKKIKDRVGLEGGMPPLRFTSSEREQRVLQADSQATLREEGSSASNSTDPSSYITTNSKSSMLLGTKSGEGGRNKWKKQKLVRD